MRPIKKWIYNDPSVSPPIKEFYKPYQEAKEDLERNIDGYCSYCERPATDDAVHVEHIQPKGLSQYSSLKYSWANFLLACARCNGADNKGNKDVVIGTVHLPNLNNTAKSVLYKEGGYVEVNNALSGVELINASAIIDLVGLDKRPGHPAHLPKDKRWDRRREVWEIADRQLKKYEATPKLTDEETIRDLARGYGFWSVWYSVFKDHIDVKRILVTSFKGTEINCFDQYYNLQNRNPSDLNDTV